MKKYSILVVDDEEFILSIFSLVLQDAGHQVSTAQNGEQAIKIAREILPDLIVCDINMPGMDGKSVLEEIRSDPDLAHLQFVLITGNPHAMTPREGMVRGADDFLTKPIEREALLQCVESRLKRANINQKIERKVLSELRSGLRSSLPHELFTPMAGMVGIAYLLKDSWESMKKEEIQELLSKLEQSGWRLERTLRNYLTILDLDEMSPENFQRQGEVASDQVGELIHTEANRIAEKYHRSGDLNFADFHPATLSIDHDHLALLIQELVENAFSFSQKGQAVTISLADGHTLSIQDLGRGIKPDQMSSLCSFRQFDRKAHEQQGLGLGLALVRKIIELNDFDWSMESQIDQGTTVTIQFK